MNHNEYRIIYFKICLICLDLGASKSADPGGATAAEPGENVVWDCHYNKCGFS